MPDPEPDYVSPLALCCAWLPKLFQPGQDRRLEGWRGGSAYRAPNLFVTITAM